MNNNEKIIELMRLPQSTLIQHYLYLEEKLERIKQLYETDKESWKEQMYELQQRIDKAIEYITSEESIETFRTIESREEWLKINHILLEILKGSDKDEN